MSGCLVRSSRSTGAARSSRFALAACLLAAAGAVHALPGDDAMLAMAAADTMPRTQVDVTTSSLPRFDASDFGTQTSRIDLALLPDRRAGLGLALGVSSRTPAGPGFVPPSTVSNAIDVGLHWRYTFESNHRVDVTAWRRMPQQDALSMIQTTAEPTYGARVEMRMRPSGKGLVADKGFLGFQLESGARITIKRRDGRPMVYYRNTF